MSTQNQDTPDIPVLTHAAPSQVKRILVKNIKAGLVTYIHGSPGIGKSQLVHSVAKDFNLCMLDERLSQADPTDLKGFGTVINGRATFVPFDNFPVEHTPLPLNPETKQPYDGWLLFLDELSSAPRAVQAAAYKLILDRMVGNHHLHKKVAIIGAGNLETDNAIVEEMSTALQSRMAHVQMVVDNAEWINWAAGENIDFRIPAYISYKPTALYTFSPDHTDHTYACPRTWAMMDRVLKTCDGDLADPDLLPRAAGVISDGVAREFIQFCGIANQLPSLAKILADPKGIVMPSELSVMFLLCGSLSSHATSITLDPIMEFVSRMPIEFQVVFLRSLVLRKKELLGSPAVQKWLKNTSVALF